MLATQFLIVLLYLILLLPGLGASLNVVDVLQRISTVRSLNTLVLQVRFNPHYS